MIPTPRLSHLSADEFDLVYEPAGQIMGSSSTLYLCTDINPHACKCTYRTGIENQIPLNSINTSFALPFHSRLAHVIDVILFNPPYVPTISSEATQAQDVGGIAGSWAGGSDGMQVTNRFLDMVDDLLSPRGRFYLVAVKENNIPEIQRRMFDTYGLESTVVLSRRAGREHLSVIRFARIDKS
ncbi:hemk methyltransferase family member 2-like [Moniliophthora roreri]|nr:hemk methyltransferase family member 2-like [Moniliophthora roreri]